MARTINCVFCFKQFEFEGCLHCDSTLVKCRETTAKFFKFLQRHLNSEIHHVNQESMASLLITGGVTIENESFDIYSCSDCDQLMSHFLDLYNQLKVIELKVNGAMNSLVSVMSTATKVPSKVKAFNKSFDTSGDEKKLKGIHDFRQDLITKCNKCYQGLPPHIALQKQRPNSFKKRNVHNHTSLDISSPDNGTNFNESNEQNLTKEEPIIMFGNEREYNLNSELELEPCPSDIGDRFPGSCDEDEMECENVPEPELLDRCSPITITIEPINASTSEPDTNKTLLRARKRIVCKVYSQKSTTPPDLLITADDEKEICNEQASDCEETEEVIIQHYANTHFEFVRKHKQDSGNFVTTRSSKAVTFPIKTEEVENICIKTLSQCLSPAQQRLTAAVLHRPKFPCPIKNCSEKFVFKDQLESHSKLHGEFSCSLCSHVDPYAPKLAEHILTNHCTIMSGNKAFGPFVSCPISPCVSSDPVEFYQRNYVFHYLTEHLSLDVSSIGCSICHYTKPNGVQSNHNHFQMFHGIFNMKPEDVRECESCPAFFSADSRLVSHMLVFHNQFPTSCPDCHQKFKSKNGYRDHRKKCKKRNRDLFQHLCTFPNCNKKFKSLAGLTAHRRSCAFNVEAEGCADVVIIGKTEQDIIQYYAINQFEFVRKTKRNMGKYLIVPNNPKARNLTETNDTCIKTLSQCLSPVQQRLAAALLHQPQFSCKFSDCFKEFAFEDQLEAHYKLHGKFSCSLCSNVETYAPKLAEHVLTEHCTSISSTSYLGTFVACSVPTCASLASPVEFHEKHYVFHYLTEHLSLDVSSIGCPICHFTHSKGGFSSPNHFKFFHDIFNMKTEDVHQCESCPAFFCTGGKLNMHKLAFHNQVSNYCTDCHKTFGVGGKTRYMHHRTQCTGRKWELFSHRCPFPNCDKKFSNAAGLICHKKACKLNPEGIWLDCPKCKKQFGEEEQLKRHLETHKRKRIHDGNKKKMCEV